MTANKPTKAQQFSIEKKSILMNDTTDSPAKMRLRFNVPDVKRACGVGSYDAAGVYTPCPNRAVFGSRCWKHWSGAANVR